MDVVIPILRLVDELCGAGPVPPINGTYDALRSVGLKPMGNGVGAGAELLISNVNSSVGSCQHSETELVQCKHTLSKDSHAAILTVTSVTVKRSPGGGWRKNSTVDGSLQWQDIPAWHPWSSELPPAPPTFHGITPTNLELPGVLSAPSPTHHLPQNASPFRLPEPPIEILFLTFF